MVTECYTKKPEGFRSRAFRNCCSWGRGNRYAMTWKLHFPFINFHHLEIWKKMQIDIILNLFNLHYQLHSHVIRQQEWSTCWGTWRIQPSVHLQLRFYFPTSIFLYLFAKSISSINFTIKLFDYVCLSLSKKDFLVIELLFVLFRLLENLLL